MCLAIQPGPSSLLFTTGIVSMGKNLGSLMNGYQMVNLLGTLERDISSIAYDSRKVESGGLFVAMKGTRQNGARFIQEALSRGAVAIVTEAGPEDLMEMGVGIQGATQIHVEDARHALAWVSAQFHGHPSSQLQLVGITGTNGKTTLTYALESIFKTAGRNTGVIGSINYRYGEQIVPAPMTTPESLDIDSYLTRMVAEGVSDCFLEVSSHALEMKRVRELKFKTAVFTNFSRDHLDFHPTMESYKDAKLKLFRECEVMGQVVNIDDPVGREIVSESNKETLTTGIERIADVRAENCQTGPDGVSFVLKTPFGSSSIQSPLLGQHNIYNLLSGAAVALMQGLSISEISKGIQALTRVPGRFDRVDAGQNFTVAVDYSHTDDALAKALKAARGIAHQKVIVVFGCGGDRDPGKRPAMARVAIEGSDHAVITSDNPRTEDPNKIIREVIAGLPEDSVEGEAYSVFPEREKAIHFAIEKANEGDFVLIAGKGHEDYQILGEQRIHFDDCEVAEDALKKRLEEHA